MHRTAAAKRYRRRTWAVSLIYCALVAVYVALKQVEGVPHWAVLALAIASAVPIVLLLAVLGSYLREESDEYVRDRCLLSMLIGLGVLLSLSSVLGMLQAQNVLGSVPVFLAFPIWACVWGGAQWLFSRRDRRLAVDA